MCAEERDLDVLRRLASMPFIDRLELAAVSGRSEGAAHTALASLRAQGVVDSIQHASGLTATTRRFFATPAGLHRLASAAGVDMDDLLRAYPVSAQWRRVLLERLDAAGVIYRLASAAAEAGGPLRFRWYRSLPMDAAFILPGRRPVVVARQGPTAERTAFGKRLWRLLNMQAAGAGRPPAVLLLMPDEVRLRHARRLLTRAPGPVYLALEQEVARAGVSDRVWRTPSDGAPLTLRVILSSLRPGGELPSEPPVSSSSPPDDLNLPEPGPDVGIYLLPVLLKPAEKRLLDCFARWPWIAPSDLGGLLGLSDSGVSKVTARLDGLALISHVHVEGRRRLALSDRGLALLARRDRSAVGAALKRWSAEPVDADLPFTWRNVSGTRSRQLLRHIGHTEAAQWFLARLARQARTLGIAAAQFDPPHRAARYFRHEGKLRSVHPDAFGVIRRGRTTWPFFLEWERRAAHPSSMAARLAPYLRYFSSKQPVEGHGAQPLVLIVFDDSLAEARFHAVARAELTRAGVRVPLWVSHREALEHAGPLGPVWRSPDVLEPVCAFG